LFRKTVLNEAALAKEFEDKTPNWDSDRIAEVDTIILKWLFASFKIPFYSVKVTLNEYLEIAKGILLQKYIFINGILDNL
jgi:N utilization substance protein B